LEHYFSNLLLDKVEKWKVFSVVHINLFCGCRNDNYSMLPYSYTRELYSPHVQVFSHG